MAFADALRINAFIGAVIVLAASLLAARMLGNAAGTSVTA
jgi:hypothetical protein